MFREMRRKKQLLLRAEAEEILQKGLSGVLAVSGDAGYPYAVPLSYVYHDHKIYFHGAKAGHKLDGIKRNCKVSFCVIEKDDVQPVEYTTYFQSVIVFGTARIVEDIAEIRKFTQVLGEKYCSDYVEGIPAEIAKQIKNLCIVEIDVEHMTGKRAIELV